MENVIKILLVDDQILFVQSLRDVLQMRSEEIEVVGIATNGIEALSFLEEHEVDIVLMDVRMPVMDGVKACAEVHCLYPDVQVVMLTTFDDDEYVFEALNKGAVGYLLKNIPPEELIRAIVAVKNKIYQLSPSVMQKLIHNKVPSISEERVKEPEPNENSKVFEDLSSREKDILRLLVAGKNNREIASQLFIAQQTVKNHLCIIYDKLMVRDRIQAIRKIEPFFGEK